LLSEKLAHQPQRRSGVTAALYEHVKDLTLRKRSHYCRNSITTNAKIPRMAINPANVIGIQLSRLARAGDPVVVRCNGL
jgi:hypothetical protein